MGAGTVREKGRRKPQRVSLPSLRHPWARPAGGSALSGARTLI